MKLLITKQDIALVSIASILLLVAIIAGRLILGETALFFSPVLCTAITLFMLLEIYRRLSDNQNYRQNSWDESQGQTSTVITSPRSANETNQDRDYQPNQDYLQIESLLSLFFTLKPSLPLPNTRGWAICPDLLKKITEVILLEKPSLIVETGSGVSTLIIAYCLKQLGTGRLISLEHDQKYAAASQKLISFHGMDEIVTIIHAPLQELEIDEQKWLWYNTDFSIFNQPIDLLIIDGPPGTIQKLSRYPALPLLYGYLNERSVIILDDAHREDEKKIVALWEQEFSDISSEFLDTEKGGCIIHKSSKI